MHPTLHDKNLEGEGEQSVPDFKFHLELSQKLAKIGSWELDLTIDDQDAPQYWSDETYRILGYEPGEITPSFNTFLKSIHPDDYHAVLEAAEHSIKHGREYDMEQRHVTPGGCIVATKSVAQVIRDKDGNPLKLCGAMKDITDKKAAHQALDLVNKEMSTFFEKIDEVLYSVDMQEYSVLQMSPACEKVYGYTAAEMKQNPHQWLEVILEEDRHIIYESDPVMRRGDIVANEYRIRHKDGSIRWLGGTLTPTLDENGTLLRIDGVVSDITARKQAELALKDSELKFRTLLENSSDGIAIYSADWKLTFASSSMSRISGYAPDELIDREISHLIHPDDFQSFFTIIDSLSEKPGNMAQFTFRFRSKEGGWIWLECVTQNLLHEPPINGFVNNFRDVTERIEHEEALKSANKHLKKTNEELDRFVYSVSHDLRAPLASILGLIEFTESETSDLEVLENLAMMKSSVKKLDGFILDILDYSKNSRLEVKAEEISFTRMLNDTVKNLKFMSRDNGEVAIKFSISENQAFYSDRSRLHVILNNLISNAIRYYNPDVDGSYVAVDVIVNPAEALITIKDNGMGIEEEFHSKIFDMFYRVSRKSVGSGLGLYIVKEAVDKLNGTLELYSEPGIGTEFKLRIPNLRSN